MPITPKTGSLFHAESHLYQLIRQSGAVKDRTMGIEVSGPGVRAYVFTFG
jgi:hypothetical protein